MGYSLTRDRLVDRRGVDAPQANMSAGHRRDRPRKAPAVAVEHWQGPEIDRVVPHAPDENVAERIQIGAAVMIHDPLRITGRTRSVVESNRFPLIFGRLFREGGVASCEKCLVIHLPEKVAAPA